MGFSLRFAVITTCMMIGGTASADDFGSFLQTTHDRASEQVTSIADRIDSIFRSRNTTDIVNPTTVRLSVGHTWLEAGEGADDFQTSLSFRLPTLERRGQDVLDQLKSLPNSDSDDEDGAGESRSSNVSSLRALEELHDIGRRWNFHLEPGIQVGREFRYLGRARVRRNFDLGSFEHRFVQELKWTSWEYWSTDSELTSDHGLADGLLFRGVNQLAWAISKKEFSTTHGPSVIWNFVPTSAISLNLRMQNAFVDRVYGVQSYSSTIGYNQVLIGNWSFLEITTGLSFPRAQEFKGAWSLSAKIEAVFGEI